MGCRAGARENGGVLLDVRTGYGLGEGIGFDDSNQYFIATHNPYLLMAILEKARADDVSVFATYFR